MHANVNLLTIWFLGICTAPAHGELSGLQSLLQYFGLNMYMNGIGSMSRGQCEYTFESYALMRELHTCVPDDEHILHLIEVPQQRKPPLMIKCLQPDPVQDPNATNVTVLVMNSAKEIVNLLKPIGNATKRHEPGSCVVIHFCTATSAECARVAEFVNFLPYTFPTLPIAYVDAYKFTRFNAEFGVVSLPTLMIFHQGRPLIKYDRRDRASLRSFIMRHTNVRSVANRRTMPKHVVKMLSNGPLSTYPSKTTDIYLIIAWGFIFICLANYMRRTLYWKRLVEMVQRNWRESEETQMDMID